MGSRWYNIAVIVLWLVAMTWLVTRKVIPDWLVGDPPDYRRIVSAQQAEPPVGWQLTCKTGDDEKWLGWALCQTIVDPQGPASLESRVRFDAMGVLESRSFWGEWFRGHVHREMKIESHSVVRVDGLGNLLDFASSFSLEGITLGQLKGEVVDDGRIHLTITAERLSDPIEKTVVLPRRALLGGELSPQSQLPHLRDGQTWSVPVYNPLQPAKGLELLHAAVEGSEPYEWEGEVIPVWRVVYRSDPGYGPSLKRGQLWVHYDGTVLKQEATFWDLTLVFTRMTRAETQRLEAQCGGVGGKPRPGTAAAENKRSTRTEAVSSER